MTDWRLEAYERWLTKKEPNWAMVDYPEIDFQDQYYYARPKSMAVKPKSLDEVDPKLLETYEKLGIPLKEQMILAGVEGAEDAPAEGRKVAVDAVFDSVSVGTTFQEELKKAGVIFCSISEAIREHPELVKKYLGSVVPVSRQLLCDAELVPCSRDGSFVYVPPGVRCPMELSHLFPHQCREHRPVRADADHCRQGVYVSYLEGCTAPQRDDRQLHAAVVEIIIEEDAEVKYSTVQNWYPGDENGKGGIYNFVTKRADCRGDRAKVMWTQVETGSAVTWKYPSLHPARRRQPGRVLFHRHRQQHAAGRYRHQDDPSGQAHQVADRVQGDQRGQGAEHLSRAGVDAPQGQGMRATIPSATAC